MPTQALSFSHPRRRSLAGAPPAPRPGRALLSLTLQSSRLAASRRQGRNDPWRESFVPHRGSLGMPWASRMRAPRGRAAALGLVGSKVAGGVAAL